MAQELFLGIDIGTGGVRACAIDAEARIVGIATTALPAPRQEDAAIDQEPELWLRRSSTFPSTAPRERCC